MNVVELLSGLAPAAAEAAPAVTVEPAEGAARSEYHALRREEFVVRQGIFAGPGAERDERDEDPRTIVLAARAADGAVVGGVRISPVGSGPDGGGWWHGSRLVVAPAARRSPLGVGAALVRAAAAAAEAAGALRFDASVAPANRRFFERLGWQAAGEADVAGVPHVAMRWPCGRIAALVAATKAPLGALLADLAPGGDGWVGDDGVPVPGSDLIAACDAITPAMVERDPEWAGWCSVLVNINDLSAMGATPVGLLDAVAGLDAARVSAVLAGLRRAAGAWGIPILGGHTQLGVPGALTVTALGRTSHPVPAGGGRPGDSLRLTADLAGGWRPGYHGRQWDSTSVRSTADLRAMAALVAERRPAAAKDVSMAGIAGTAGMLAEASGCGVEIDVAALPRPAAAATADWLTCFPGFAMLSADRPDADGWPAEPVPGVHSRKCGILTGAEGVHLVWPDGQRTTVLAGAATGLGPARRSTLPRTTTPPRPPTRSEP